jgi:predicted GTPase
MSYSESRNHFEKARINTADAVTIEMLDGLKHLSHAIEEDVRTLEQHIRNIQESADRYRTHSLPVEPVGKVSF